MPGRVRAQGRSEQGSWGWTLGQAAGVGRVGQHHTRPACLDVAGGSAGVRGSETEGVQGGGGLEEGPEGSWQETRRKVQKASQRN